MPKAIIYARFSPRPDADESTSNEKQIQRCKEFCAAKGYEVVAIYQDSDASGGDDKKRLDPTTILETRPGLLDALDSLRRGWVLVVRWRSRIARDVFLEEWCHRRAAAVGAKIEAADESNGEDPQQVWMRQMLAAFRQYERAVIKKATSRAMRRHQANGRRMSHPDLIPWGKSIDPDNPDKLIDNSEEIEVRDIILELRQAGRTLRGIARWLEENGFKRRGKATWTHERVRAILRRSGVQS